MIYIFTSIGHDISARRGSGIIKAEALQVRFQKHTVRLYRPSEIVRLGQEEVVPNVTLLAVPIPTEVQTCCIKDVSVTSIFSWSFFDTYFPYGLYY